VGNDTRDNQLTDTEELDQHLVQLNSSNRKIKTKTTKLKNGKFTKIFLFAGVGIVLMSAFAIFFFLKTCLAIAPTYTKVNQIVNQPFIIYLNETVSSVPLHNIKISPAVDGKWAFKSGKFIDRDELIFTPSSYFKVDTSYTVTFANIKRVLFGDTQISDVHFKTELAPNLAKTGVNGIANNAIIAADYVFETDLISSNKGLRKLELHTNPDIPVTQKIINDRQFIWKPTGLLPQGSTLTIQVYDSKNDVILATRTLEVASEPSVTIPVKKDYFNNNDVATITFNQPIEPDSSKYITFNIAGQGQWQSDTVYTFTPKGIAPGRTYTYIIGTGLRSKSGGILAADQTATFSTTGPVIVTSSSPHGNNLSQASEQVSFSFDQPVDHNSVINHFSISSGKIASTAWQGNTFVANVTDLGYQQTIIATLSAGVQNSGFGLPSAQSFSDSFTTEIRVIRLNVPYYHQQYAATCAAASLRMVLAYRGVNTDDMSIIYQMGYSPTVEDKSTDPPTWDDPQEMFVGSVSGTIKSGTSAGPDAQPIAKASESFGISAQAVTNIDVNWIAQQLYNGDPVILFGAYSNTTFTSWQTPSGRVEKMNLTSHVRVVTGLKGEPGNPIGFWISDPIDGANYWTTNEVISTINLDAYHQAVVVY
jgi:uncharacterized protein YvpB